MTEKTLLPVLAALADETRWSILVELSEGDLTASELAQRLPVTRQAIARHLGVLREAGLVDSRKYGRDVRFRVLGSELSATARRLDAIGDEWTRRLDAIRRLAEG